MHARQRRLRSLALVLGWMLVLAGSLPADDTAIFGRGNVDDIPPNVLIILDNSSSMDRRFDGQGFDNTGDIDYKKLVENSGNPNLTAYDPNRVYCRTVLETWLDNSEYYEYAPSIDDIQCDDPRESLRNGGEWNGRIQKDNGGCAGWFTLKRYLRTGRRLNYLQVEHFTKFEAAKAALANIVESQSDKIRFSVMTFNSDDDNPYDPDEIYPGNEDPWWHAQRDYLSPGTDPDGRFHVEQQTVNYDHWSVMPYENQFDAESGAHLMMDGVGWFNVADGLLDPGSLKQGNHYALEIWHLWVDNYYNYDSVHRSDPDDDDGARVVVPFADNMNKQQVVKTIKDIPLGDDTPLAEAMAEAGRYLAGTRKRPLKSWANPDCYYPEPDDYAAEHGTLPVHGGGHMSHGDDPTYSYPNYGKVYDPRPSPDEAAIKYPCQKNFIVIVTDGEPKDRPFHGHDEDGCKYDWDIFNDYLGSGQYISDDDSNGRVDEMARYLFLNDLLPNGTGDPLSYGGTTDGTGTEWETQNVQTFCLGIVQEDFNLWDHKTWINSFDVDYLEDVARTCYVRRNDNDPENPSRDQLYNLALVSDFNEFSGVFQNILTDIFRASSGFAAAVVPVDNDNIIFNSDSVYLPVFEPSLDNVWYGNLKKFVIGPNGKIYGKHGVNGPIAEGVTGLLPAVTDAGALKDTACDLWDDDRSLDAGTHYTHANTGGAAENISIPNRKVYARVGDSVGKVNLDTIGGLSLKKTREVLDIPEHPWGFKYDQANVKKVLARVRGTDGKWPLADVMHSSPVVKKYRNNKGEVIKTVIFVGANDGCLHAFEDDEGEPAVFHIKRDKDGAPVLDGDGNVIVESISNITDDTVSELWAFVPGDQVSRLKYGVAPYASELPDNASHAYFVDGSPVLYSLAQQKGDPLGMLIFGRRRGGKGYTTMDVSDAASITTLADNKLRWWIGEDFDQWAHIGQSWGTPLIRTIKTASGNQKAVILPGGYDPNQDQAVPAASDTTGKILYAVDAARSGAQNTTLLKLDASNHCIVDVVGFGFDDPHVVDTLYAGDLGGKVFGFTARAAGEADSSNWTRHTMLSVSDTKNSRPLKFMSAPDIVAETGFEYVFIGSGDRAHPNEVDTVNRFYALKHRWCDADDLPLGEVTDLQDITDATYDTEVLKALISKDGWFFKFKAAGEKVVSRPITYDGVVYFTTYQPMDENTDDVCRRMNSVGTARLYAIDYKRGAGVFQSFVTDDSDEPYEGSEQLDKRSLVLGLRGIPPQPRVVVTKDGASLTVGSLWFKIPDVPRGVIRHYWKQN